MVKKAPCHPKDNNYVYDNEISNHQQSEQSYSEPFFLLKSQFHEDEDQNKRKNTYEHL
jgi:hypothetical protein